MVRIVARPGLPKDSQDLRDAAPTFLLVQGMTIEDVKDLLGHSSITMTSNTYGHVLEERQRQVARAMDAVLAGYHISYRSVTARESSRRR